MGSFGFWAVLFVPAYFIARYAFGLTFVPLMRYLLHRRDRVDPDESWQMLQTKINDQVNDLQVQRFDDVATFDRKKTAFLFRDRRARVGVKVFQIDELRVIVFVYAWLRYFNSLDSRC